MKISESKTCDEKNPILCDLLRALQEHGVWRSIQHRVLDTPPTLMRQGFIGRMVALRSDSTELGMVLIPNQKEKLKSTYDLSSCSFCQKSGSEVAQLVAGFDASICNECVQNAAKVCDPKLASAASKKKRDLAEQCALNARDRDNLDD